MSWSSGKDSALALHEVRSDGEVEVVGLLTMVNAATRRVAMHGVRRVLLEAQARPAPGSAKSGAPSTCQPCRTCHHFCLLVAKRPAPLGSCDGRVRH
jgi:hypothetical protein